MDYELRQGQHVYTTDGEKLGDVKEMRGQYFKVDASMKPDYWLSLDCVRGGLVGGDSVTVAFPKDQLGEYKADLDDR